MRSCPQIKSEKRLWTYSQWESACLECLWPWFKSQHCKQKEGGQGEREGKTSVAPLSHTITGAHVMKM